MVPGSPARDRGAAARVALPPGAEILDAGCGSGRNMVDLARLGTVTGVEIADVSVARARERDVGEVVQCSITELPFADAQFDLAVCLRRRSSTSRTSCGRCASSTAWCAPGGTLVVTVPAYQWLWSEHDVINHHERRYTRRDAAARRAQAGWRAVRTTYFNGCCCRSRSSTGASTRRSHLVGEPVSDLQRTPERLNTVLEMAAAFRGARDRDGLADPGRPLARGRLQQAGMSPDEGVAPGLAPDPGAPSRPPPGSRRLAGCAPVRAVAAVARPAPLPRGDSGAERPARVRAAEPERLRQHVLLGGGQVDAALVAQLLLRRLRSQRLHHRRQAAARALAAGR